MSRPRPLFFIFTLCILAILMMEMAGCISVQESPSTQTTPTITTSRTAIARARSGTIDGYYQYLEGDTDYHADFIQMSNFNVFVGDEVSNASAKDGENIGVSGYYLPISPTQVLVVYTHKTSKDGVNTFTGNTSYFCVTSSCDQIHDEKNPDIILTWYEDFS